MLSQKIAAIQAMELKSHFLRPAASRPPVPNHPHTNTDKGSALHGATVAKPNARTATINQ
jgi:hypothetical protein